MESPSTTNDNEQGSQQTGTRTDPCIINVEITQPPDGREDDLKKTRKVAITIGLFIASTSAALFVNTITPQHLFFLLIPYDFLLILSLFIGFGLVLYSIMKGNNITAFSVDEVVIINRLMITGFTTTFLTLMLRGVMVPYSYPAWYVYFMVIGIAFLYLWMFWNAASQFVLPFIFLE